MGKAIAALALLLAVAMWGAVMWITFHDGHDGWTVVLGVVGAAVLVDVAGELFGADGQ